MADNTGTMLVALGIIIVVLMWVAALILAPAAIIKLCWSFLMA